MKNNQIIAEHLKRVVKSYVKVTFSDKIYSHVAISEESLYGLIECTVYVGLKDRNYYPEAHKRIFLEDGRAYFGGRYYDFNDPDSISELECDLKFWVHEYVQ